MSLRLSFLICKVGIIMSVSGAVVRISNEKGLDKHHHHHHHIFSAYSKKVRLF